MYHVLIQKNVIVIGGSPGLCGTTKIAFNPIDLRCLLMIPREKKYRTISSLIDHACKTLDRWYVSRYVRIFEIGFGRKSSRKHHNAYWPPLGYHLATTGLPFGYPLANIEEM